MPEIFRFYGFSFFFWSREHEPIHIHVEGNEGYAVFDYNGTSFIIRENKGIKVKDIKRIQAVIDTNKDIIIARWKEYFE